MIKLIGILFAFSMVTVLTGCPSNDHRYKKTQHHKAHTHNPGGGKHTHRLPGDNKSPAPNCAADGPGCKQFNPNL